MGMDLSALTPQNPDTTDFHVNWTGWGILGDLLIELGCNTREMSGSNDGDIVTADTAATWGHTIKDNINSIIIEKYPSSAYSGGYEERLRVEGSTTPLVMSSAETIRTILAESSPLLARVDTASTPMNNPDQAPETVRAVDDPETLAWLTQFADFCINSGGFAQY